MSDTVHGNVVNSSYEKMERSATPSSVEAPRNSDRIADAVDLASTFLRMSNDLIKLLSAMRQPTGSRSHPVSASLQENQHRNNVHQLPTHGSPAPSIPDNQKKHTRLDDCVAAHRQVLAFSPTRCTPTTHVCPGISDNRSYNTDLPKTYQLDTSIDISGPFHTDSDNANNNTSGSLGNILTARNNGQEFEPIPIAEIHARTTQRGTDNNGTAWLRKPNAESVPEWNTVSEAIFDKPVNGHSHGSPQAVCEGNSLYGQTSELRPPECSWPPSALKEDSLYDGSSISSCTINTQVFQDDAASLEIQVDRDCDLLNDTRPMQFAALLPYSIEASESKLKQFQDARWMARYKELSEYRRQNGHCLVNTKTVSRQLLHWVKRQRYQYKLKYTNRASVLCDRREKMLDDLDFCWDGHAANWEERFQDLLAYKSIHGHVDVPVAYSENPRLGIWVKSQRRQFWDDFNKTSGERQLQTRFKRYERLQLVGFQWKVRPLRRKPEMDSP